MVCDEAAGERLQEDAPRTDLHQRFFVPQAIEPLVPLANFTSVSALVKRETNSAALRAATLCDVVYAIPACYKKRT